MHLIGKRLRVVLAVAAVGALLAAGCNNTSSTTPPQAGGNPASPQDGSPFHLIADSVSKTTDAGSSRVAIDLKSTGGTSGSFEMAGAGDFDYANQVGRMSMTVPVVAGQGGGTIEMIIDHETIYMKLPASETSSGAAASIFGNKPWIKMDLSGFSKLGASASSLSSSDPSQALDFLLGASKNVENLGTESIRGVDTTHYHVTLDLTRAADQVPAGIRKSYEQSLKTLGTTSLPADVWVDGNDLVRKMAFTFETPSTDAAGVSTGGASVTESIEFYDFGTDVSVTPPPASQTTDLTKLLTAFAKGIGNAGG